MQAHAAEGFPSPVRIFQRNPQVLELEQEQVT